MYTEHQKKLIISSEWHSLTIPTASTLITFGHITMYSTVRAPVFGRYQFFGTSEHYGKTHGSLLTWWMNYNYIACCWFPTSNNILILPSQFWQIGFESDWLHCSKCRILVLLRYSLCPKGEKCNEMGKEHFFKQQKLFASWARCMPLTKACWR